MNHVLCSRCGAALEHLVALLGHYQEVHGRVPMAKYVVEECWCCGCPVDWPATQPISSQNPRCDRCRAECYKPGPFVVPMCRLAVTK